MYKRVHLAARVVVMLWLAALAGTASQAHPALPDDTALIRVLDVGQALSVVAALPGDYYVVFDAGDDVRGNPVLAGVNEVVPDGEDIDLLVISHPDFDHLNNALSLLDAYRHRIRRVVRTGFPEGSGVRWRDLDSTITARAAAGEFVETNLQHTELPPGATYRYGESFVTFLAGAPEPPPEWGLTSTSERKNAVSLAARISYRGGSVLLAGDAFGRQEGTSETAESTERMMEPPAATEQAMLAFAPAVPLASDVLVAAHHGADDGSSAAFIGTVDPTWVVFSAGEGHGHPRQTTADRYIAAGVSPWRILRTDAEDPVENPTEGKEWQRGDWPRPPGGPFGDGGTVDIAIIGGGDVFVRYRGPVRD
jgi:beta-lactamase superfamily II metal-dependent hydrolase